MDTACAKHCDREPEAMKIFVSIQVGLGAAALAGSALAADKGEAVFNEVCAACHGEKGAGIAGLAPPLKGSAFVLSTDAVALAAFIQKGRAGSEKKFPNLPSPMPPYGGGKEKATAVAEFIKGALQKD
jgi:mono/diheme cytochrome c family protein